MARLTLSGDGGERPWPHGGACGEALVWLGLVVVVAERLGETTRCCSDSTDSSLPAERCWLLYLTESSRFTMIGRMCRSRELVSLIVRGIRAPLFGFGP